MHHQAAAYELAADYAGTVEQNGEQVPKFQPGHLAIGDSFIDLAEALAAGDGIVVASTRDQALLDLLEAYPPLKRTTNPDGPAYELQGTRVLRRLARVRGLKGQETKDADEIAAALLAADRQEQREAAARAAGVPLEQVPPVAQPDAPLAGEALKTRAAELDIPGRSGMNADELRAAIAEAGQELAAGEDESPDPDAAGGGTSA
jgi:hypothetical protein